MTWVFSMTILRGLTEDRFRGRAFSADFGGLFLGMSLVSFLTGHLIDRGLSVRAVALGTGILAILQAVIWMRVQRHFRHPDSAPVANLE